MRKFNLMNICAHVELLFAKACIPTHTSDALACNIYEHDLNLIKFG